MKTWAKRIAGLTLAAVLGLSSVSALAANMEWKVKNYTNPASGVYEITWENYVDGQPTNLFVAGTNAEQYGLEGFVSNVQKPNSWYDISFPNWQYEEVWDGNRGVYTGINLPTGARLGEEHYTTIRSGWEVGGTHKEVGRVHSDLPGFWYTDVTYPVEYTGTNATVIEKEVPFGFDVFEIFEAGKARDVEAVVAPVANANNTVKNSGLMANAANTNRVTGTLANGAMVNLIDAPAFGGNEIDSVFYDELATSGIAPTTMSRTYYDANLSEIATVTVPVYDYTGVNINSTGFVNLVKTNKLELTGPSYDKAGNVTDAFGHVVDGWSDCVKAYKDVRHMWGPVTNRFAWAYDLDVDRIAQYTNNIITSYDGIGIDVASLATGTKFADAKWVFYGYEAAAPERIYEVLSVEGILFDGDIDDDGVLDTPVVFRYPVSNSIYAATGKMPVPKPFDGAATVVLNNVF